MTEETKAQDPESQPTDIQQPQLSSAHNTN